MSLLHCFGHLHDALFCTSIPFSYRWRLIALQPFSLLAYFLKWASFAFSKHKAVIWIPLRRAPGHSVRAVVFDAGCSSRESISKRPIHLDIHGGAFLGGIPEYDAPFCMELAKRTGAVVISTSYRYAPRYTFPTAHEDTQDVAAYLIDNCERLWGASPDLLTVSGFSAGGNLALGVAQDLAASKYHVKGSVTFYIPVDLRFPPWSKPKPPGFPTRDPFAFAMPLFDAYPGLRQPREVHSPLLNPILADIRALPPNMLFIIPTMDILVHEQTVFTDRLKKEADELNKTMDQIENEDPSKLASSVEAQGDSNLQMKKRASSKTGTMNKRPFRIETLFFENQLHGWLELPSMAIDEQTRTAAFDAGVRFIKDVHLTHGWNYDRRE